MKITELVQKVMVAIIRRRPPREPERYLHPQQKTVLPFRRPDDC